jgi:hypothetical protein
MINRTSWLLAAVLALLAIMLAPSWALAAEIRGGQNAEVAPGETIDDDLFVGGGDTVTIGGHITGDAYAAARTVVVTGTVDGDLLAAAQQVVVDGSIGGNIRAAGATITINGNVARNLTAAAQQINVSSNGRIGGSVVGVGQTLDAFGPIGRGMTVGGGTLQLAGAVGGPVLARVQTLSVAPTARLAGNLDYQAKQEATIPSGTVGGGLQFTPAPQQQPQSAPIYNGIFDLGGLVALGGSFLVGALALVLAPRASARAVELGRRQPWMSFGLGLVVLIGAPIVTILMAITLIGIPVAFILLAIYILAILLAWPAVALVVGTQISRLVRPEQPLPVLGALALGLIVLHLVTHVPFLGGLIAVCSMMFGLGLLVQALRRWRRTTEQPRAEAPLAVAAA